MRFPYFFLGGGRHNDTEFVDFRSDNDNDDNINGDGCVGNGANDNNNDDDLISKISLSPT